MAVIATLTRGMEKEKPPLFGVVIVYSGGAGGNRTRVQTWRPYAFYMLIHA